MVEVAEGSVMDNEEVPERTPSLALIQWICSVLQLATAWEDVNQKEFLDANLASRH